jgi:hypothetical protein
MRAIPGSRPKAPGPAPRTAQPPAAELSTQFPSKLAPFIGTHALPLFPQFMTSFLGQAAKPLSRIADRLPFLQGQLPKPTESLSEPLTITVG